MKYKFTEEHRKNLSIAHKNIHSSRKTEFRSGTKHPSYIDGRTLGKHHCIDCRKEISKYTAKRCKSCSNKEKWNKPGLKDLMRRKGIERWQNPEFREMMKNIPHKHHIDSDGNEDRVLYLSNSRHRKLHENAYDYLVEIGKIDDYIKWFNDTIISLLS